MRVCAVRWVQNTGGEVSAGNIPEDSVEFAEGGRVVTFESGGRRWRCDLRTYALEELGAGHKGGVALAGRLDERVRA